MDSVTWEASPPHLLLLWHHRPTQHTLHINCVLTRRWLSTINVHLPNRKAAGTCQAPLGKPGEVFRSTWTVHSSETSACFGFASCHCFRHPATPPPNNPCNPPVQRWHQEAVGSVEPDWERCPHIREVCLAGEISQLNVALKGWRKGNVPEAILVGTGIKASKDLKMLREKVLSVGQWCNYSGQIKIRNRQIKIRKGQH